jgi:hypothetical protein
MDLISNSKQSGVADRRDADDRLQIDSSMWTTLVKAYRIESLTKKTEVIIQSLLFLWSVRDVKVKIII